MEFTPEQKRRRTLALAIVVASYVLSFFQRFAPAGIAQDLAASFQTSAASLGVLASGYANAKQLAFMANAFKAIKDATEDGNSQTGVLPVGQVQGLIHDLPTVAELFERIAKEAKAAQAKVNAALE